MVVAWLFKSKALIFNKFNICTAVVLIISIKFGNQHISKQLGRLINVFFSKNQENIWNPWKIFV